MRKYKMFLTAFILLMTLFVFSVNASDAETAVSGITRFLMSLVPHLRIIASPSTTS